MNLFDETENKYYELLAYILSEEKSFSREEIGKLIKAFLPGEEDFEVTDALFSAPDGEELVCVQHDGIITPVLSKIFPVRSSCIEKEAAKTLVENTYASHFLGEEILQKLNQATDSIDESWNPNEIKIKNVFLHGATSIANKYCNVISIVAQAIREGTAIRYDYFRPGHFEIRKAEIFPVKIEFSLVNDRFRICAYDSTENRFIKMNLDNMSNVMPVDKSVTVNLSEEYKEFIRLNTKKVVLDVEPVKHVVERCFRVFSCYERKARYDRTENKYRLEISYFKPDEKEVIKNILSMGSYVMVTEPRIIQKEVYRRIMAATQLYE